MTDHSHTDPRSVIYAHDWMPPSITLPPASRMGPRMQPESKDPPAGAYKYLLQQTRRFETTYRVLANLPPKLNTKDRELVIACLQLNPPDTIPLEVWCWRIWRITSAHPMTSDVLWPNNPKLSRATALYTLKEAMGRIPFVPWGERLHSKQAHHLGSLIAERTGRLQITAMWQAAGLRLAEYLQLCRDYHQEPITGVSSGDQPERTDP